MQISKKDINKILILFLISHIVIWTFVPYVFNINLPLDTIEALAYGNDLQLGYDKYPPLFPLIIEFVFQIFGNQDWAFYFLSQIFITSSFIIIFKFSCDFFQNQIFGLISVLLLEGIFFHNFTTPELNPILGQMPFLTLTVFYCWKAFNQNDNLSWFLFGVFAALSVLIFYLSFYLLLSLALFFIYNIIKNKNFNFKYLIALVSFFIILTPHLIWILNNNPTTINYALFRSFGDPLTGLPGPKIIDHIFYPLIFLTKQILIVVPAFFIFFLIIRKFKIKINYKDKKLLFLISITILPLILMFFTSIILGARIRTMWMTSFYLYTGVFFIYIFKSEINLKKIKNFFFAFLFLFILVPVLYSIDSYMHKDKRTDYPGKKISQLVQSKWDSNFSSKIEIVVGSGWVNGWYAQNLSYHLASRPKWKQKLEKYSDKGTVWIKGFNEIEKCSGILYKIQNMNDVCMFKNK